MGSRRSCKTPKRSKRRMHIWRRRLKTAMSRWKRRVRGCWNSCITINSGPGIVVTVRGTAVRSPSAITRWTSLPHAPYGSTYTRSYYCTAPYPDGAAHRNPQLRSTVPVLWWKLYRADCVPIAQELCSFDLPLPLWRPLRLRPGAKDGVTWFVTLRGGCAPILPCRSAAQTATSTLRICARRRERLVGVSPKLVPPGICLRSAHRTGEIPGRADCGNPRRLWMGRRHFRIAPSRLPPRYVGQPVPSARELSARLRQGVEVVRIALRHYFPA